MSILSGSETYLGDGLYASFDGFQAKLRAPDLMGDREVFLEPPVLAKFLAWVADLRGEIAAANTRSADNARDTD